MDPPSPVITPILALLPRRSQTPKPLSINTSIPSSTSQDPPSATLTTSAHATSTPPSIMDPPNVAALTVAALAAAVLLICIIGSLIAWLQRRRRNQIRKQLEDEYQWSSHGQPPFPRGDSESPPNVVPSSQNNRFPHLGGTSVGGQANPGNVGSAVRHEKKTVYSSDNYKNISSRASLLPPEIPRSYANNKIALPSRPERPLTMFEEDSLEVEDQNHTTINQSQTTAKSVLRRPRAPTVVRADSKPPPPPLGPLNHPGVSRVRVSSPKQLKQTSPRATSNAHAQLPTQRPIPVHPPLALSLMKPLPKIKAPSYLPEYYTSTSPRTPMTGKSYMQSKPQPSTNPPVSYPNYEPLSDAELQISAPSPAPSSQLESSDPRHQRVPSNPYDIPNDTSKSPMKTATPPVTSLVPALVSASTNTTFESLHSADITPPEQIELINTYTPPIMSPQSPLDGVKYPKVPRSVAQAIPRSNSVMRSNTTPAPTIADTLSPRLNGRPFTSTIASNQTTAGASESVRQRVRPRMNIKPPRLSVIAPDSARRTAPLTSARSSATLPPLPWSAGCGAIEVTLRHPVWDIHFNVDSKVDAGGMGLKSPITPQAMAF